MTPPDNGSEWEKDQRHVLSELKRMNAWLASLQRRFDESRLEVVREIATLKVKSGVWGATGAVLVLLGSQLLTLLKG